MCSSSDDQKYFQTHEGFLYIIPRPNHFKLILAQGLQVISGWRLCHADKANEVELILDLEYVLMPHIWEPLISGAADLRLQLHLGNDEKTVWLGCK